ncbi:hypothetical protein [Pseudonocardia sp. GCM10023141]|uniref:hypothetical protein n=1 Tax=Pseudonocardia sp. GCM10023141 TaxID=3252653 RepID=UPI003622A29C
MTVELPGTPRGSGSSQPMSQMIKGGDHNGGDVEVGPAIDGGGDPAPGFGGELRGVGERDLAFLGHGDDGAGKGCSLGRSCVDDERQQRVGMQVGTAGPSRGSTAWK